MTPKPKAKRKLPDALKDHQFGSPKRKPAAKAKPKPKAKPKAKPRVKSKRAPQRRSK